MYRWLSSAILACSILYSGAAGAQPAIPFVSATAESADGRNFTLDWKAPGVHRVRIVPSQRPDSFNGTPVAAGSGAGHLTLALADAPRWYFELVPDHGKPLVIADRSLHLSSAGNFRDVGGYRTKDGHWVRMGRAYRSNAINKLSTTDMARASALGIKIVCDLRMDNERAHSPDAVLPNTAEVSDNVMADRQPTAGGQPAAPPADATERMHQAYRDFVDLQSARRAYHDLFERLSVRTNLPTVFHCTAGKDRTGWAQAVLLTILGVPRDVILRDYALTDRYLSPQMSSIARTLKVDPAAARIIMRADPVYLEAAFREVNVSFGSFDNYLRNGLELDQATLARIRKNFL